MQNDPNHTNDGEGKPILARCPDCASTGGCVLGIRSAFRIPKEFCPATGLSRTYIYEVTTAGPGNKNAAVVAYDIREPGAKRGVRIVNGASFCQHVRSHQLRPGRPSNKTRPSPEKKKAKPAASPTTVPPATPGPAPAAEPIALPPPPPPPTTGGANPEPEGPR